MLYDVVYEYTLQDENYELNETDSFTAHKKEAEATLKLYTFFFV